MLVFRATLLATGLTAGGGAGTWLLAPLVSHSARVATHPDAEVDRAVVAVVVLVCAGALAAWWTWLLTSTVVCAVTAWRSRTPCPPWLRAPRVVRALLGVAVSAAVGTAVSAPVPTSSAASAHERARPRLPEALAGLALPDRVAGAGPARTRAHPGAPRSVRVRAGQCLWSITADRLPGAALARVARTWPLLYAANRAVVGTDPDLVPVGTRLTLPPPLRYHPRPHRTTQRGDHDGR